MKNLSISQLSPFIGCQCYFNNGRRVLKGEMTLLLLHNYEQGQCKQVVPILKPLASLTSTNLRDWWLEQRTTADALSYMREMAAAGKFSLASFISHDQDLKKLLWMMHHGFDVFNYLQTGQAFDANNDEMPDVYSVEKFNSLFNSEK